MFDKERLRSLRHEKELSQAKLASYVGLSKSLINQIEFGTRVPNANALKTIADYFKVSVDSLYKKEGVAS